MSNNDNASPGKLGEKAVRGSMWLSASSLLSRVLGAGRLLILAAILPQSELGLFGMAVVVMLFVEQLSQTGMRQALIQREGDVREYISTAWTSQILRGLILGALLFSFAEPIERFFAKEDLAELLRLLSALPVMQGFLNMGFVYLEREMQFDKIVIHRTAVSLADILLSVLLAWIWPCATALVCGRLAGVLIGIVLSFSLERRRASFSFSMLRFRELYRFGFWVFVSSLLSFTMVSGGDLVTGKVLPIEALAVYQVAYSLACMPLMEFMRILATTMYTAFSRLQGDKDRLLSAFLRVFALACMLSACSIAGFSALGSTFTSLFLKPEYGFVSALLPVLSLWGASRALGSVNSVFFQAIGRPALATIFQAVMVVLFFIQVIPLTVRFGLLGLAWGLVIAGTVSHIGRFIVLAKLLDIRISMLCTRAIVPALVGLVAYLVCILLLQLFSGFGLWFQFATGTLALVLTFLFGTIISEYRFKFGILEFLQRHLPGLNRLLEIFPLQFSRSVKGL